jgi:hypothetical protein
VIPGERKLPLAEGETSRTACARGLLRTGVDERTGELLSTAVLAERVGWCVSLVSGMARVLTVEHWNTADVDTLAAGEDTGGRKLPSNAWMALRRLGWTVAPPGGVKVNDRIVRMAQGQAGRALRSAKWHADLTAGVLTTWPGDPARRTADEWDAVREAVPGGLFLPSSVIKSRTRQTASFNAPPPGRDNDQHTHRQPTQAARSSTGRGLPPARPRHPSTVGSPVARHYL